LSLILFFADVSTRYRLATINEKLAVLESQIGYLEAAVATAQQR
jgi:hypothetical protein